MNETLNLKKGQKILEIGTGSGWHASTVAEIVAPTNSQKDKWGHVYTVEIIPELAEIASRNIKNAGYEDRITIICKDGSKGYPEESPYDRILVAAAAPDIPKSLIEQLEDEGILVIPVGGIYTYQTLFRVRKEDGNITKENCGGVAFVPLVGKYGYKI